LKSSSGLDLYFVIQEEDFNEASKTLFQQVMEVLREFWISF